MSRFDDSSSRISRIIARNDGQLVTGITREVISKLYRRPWFRALAGRVVRPREPRQWVFIVGCYNSGTTILRRLLDAHPDVSTLPQEGVNMTDAFPALEVGGWPRMMFANQASWPMDDAGADQVVARAKRDWSPFWKKGATVFVEKSIDHTTRIAWLRRHFRGARFVAIRRDPVAVCEGIMRRAAPTARSGDVVDGRYTPELVARQYAAFEQELRRHAQGQADTIEVAYEQLADHPAEVMARIFKFIGASPVALSVDGHWVTIGDERHEVINQNAVSRARLDPATIDTILSIAQAAPLPASHG